MKFSFVLIAITGHHPGNRRGPPFGHHYENRRGSPFGHHYENRRGPPFGHHYENRRGPPFGNHHGPKKETLYCEYGKSSCECKEEADSCIFNLEIDEIQTFTSYEKLFVNEPTGIATRGFEGVGYYINESGIPVTLGNPERQQCATLNNSKCTSPSL